MSAPMMRACLLSAPNCRSGRAGTPRWLRSRRTCASPKTATVRGVMSTSRPAESPAAAGAADEEPFYIPVTLAATRPRRTLKHGDTFAVLDSHGDIGTSAGGTDGIFNNDTRYLSRLELL